MRGARGYPPRGDNGRGTRYLAPLRSSPAAFIARIFYALYLVHMPLLVLTVAVAGSAPTLGTFRGYMLTACAFAISLAVCWLSYRWIEGPLIKLPHERFRYTDKPRHAAAAALERA